MTPVPADRPLADRDAAARKLIDRPAVAGLHRAACSPQETHAREIAENIRDFLK
jgi:hypothetical protein